MKTPVQRYGLWGVLLVGMGVTWLKHDGCTLEAVAAWVHHLGSRGPCMLSGVYGLAVTLHLRNAVPSMASTALCGAILGRVVMLMGTTIGVMIACLIARYLMEVWRVSRVVSLLGVMPFRKRPGGIRNPRNSFSPTAHDSSKRGE